MYIWFTETLQMAAVLWELRVVLIVELL